MVKLLTMSRHQLFLLGALWFVIPAIGLGQDVAATQEYLQLDRSGVGTLDHGPTVPPPVGIDRKVEVRRLDVDALTQIRRSGAAAARTLAFPTVRNSDIAATNPNAFGFDGLNHADQRFAGTGAFTNTQFSLEPPDQGLCVGNGYVVEAVNTAMAVYRRDGTRVSGPTSLNQFFGLSPEIVRTTGIFGDFLSDPRCHYDAQVNRFFLTILQIGVDPPTGNFLPASSVLIAVSQSGDPTGSWNRFRLDTTAHGSGGVCPCFGDQPLIGFDANGFYISTNAFSILGAGYGGAQLYAMSKSFLASGASPPFVLRIALPASFNSDGSLDFSVHPAINTRGEESGHFGAEYFLSSFDITAQLENKVVVWVLQNTALLNFPRSSRTTFRLRKKAIQSEVYGVPPDALQKQGTLPLGSLLDPTVMEMLATNEHRMQQVTFSNGNLWSAVTTGLLSPGESDVKAGIAWFSIQVNEGNEPFLPEVQDQGYVALANAALFYPAVGVNSAENVAIGFSLSGPAYFPSAGYVTLSRNGKAGKIHIAGVGVNSEDGFTGYPTLPSPLCVDLGNGKQLCEARWGDYGAAAIDEDGAIWIANEYIGPRPRSLFANWGTFLTRLTVGDDNEQK